MKISPLDLRQVNFRKVFRGFDSEEVRNFLDLVRVEMEDLRRGNEKLKDELQQALKRLAEFREKETMLRDALLTAQQVGNDLKANAQREGQLVVSEAELKATQLLNEAALRVQTIRHEIAELRQQKVSLRSDIQMLLDRAAAWLAIDTQSDLIADQQANIHLLAPSPKAGKRS